MRFLFTDYVYILPEIDLLVLLLIFLFYFFIPQKYSNEYFSYLLYIPVLILTMLFFLLGFMLVSYDIDLYEAAAIFRGQLITDPLSFFFKLVVVFFTSLYLPLVSNYLKLKGLQLFEFFGFVLLVVLAVFFLSSSFDFLTVYAAIELQSLILYILATQERYTFAGTEAGLKYFVIGSLASGFLLYGITFEYASMGLTNFLDISRFLVLDSYNSFIPIVGSCFIFAAFFFKLGLAPFHLWLPDVYEGSSTPATALFATISKIGLVAVLVRLSFTTFYDFNFILQNVLVTVALFSIVIGSFGALNQINLKRLFAYSGISHMGFICLGLATNSPIGLASVLLYLVIYLVLSLSIFGVILLFTTKVSYFKKTEYYDLTSITDLISLRQSNPTAASIFMLSLFSLAGVPPLAGFFSKYYVLSSAISSGFYFAAVIAILASVISCFYYIRLVKILYFENKYQEKPYITQTNYSVSLILGFLASINILFLFIASPLFTLCSYIVNIFYS